MPKTPNSYRIYLALCVAWMSLSATVLFVGWLGGSLGFSVWILMTLLGVAVSAWLFMKGYHKNWNVPWACLVLQWVGLAIFGYAIVGSVTGRQDELNGLGSFVLAILGTLVGFGLFGLSVLLTMGIRLIDRGENPPDVRS